MATALTPLGKLVRSDDEDEIDVVKTETLESFENTTDFTMAWDLSDMCLQTDDETLIYVNRATLCQWSPVFKVMLLTGNFKERKQEVVKIPEKDPQDLIKFMKVLHPPTSVIGYHNVNVILKLADEYQITKLMLECEQFLLAKPCVASLSLAEKYRLKKLEQACITHLEKVKYQHIKQDKEYMNLSGVDYPVVQLLDRKMAYMQKCLVNIAGEVEIFTNGSSANEKDLFRKRTTTRFRHDECVFQQTTRRSGNPRGYADCKFCLFDVINRHLVTYENYM